MSKSTSTKSKQPPWIPAGKGMPQHKKRTKPVTIMKNKKDGPAPTKVSTKVLPEWETGDVLRKEANQDADADMISLSSHSSYEFERLNQEKELDIHHISLLKEMKLLYVHFEDIKSSYLSAHRLIDYQDIQDSSVTELFIEAGSFLKTLHALFDDLEYAMSVLENTLNENQRTVEFSGVLRNKEKLLSTLLGMYKKVILIFEVVLEKQDFKELSRVQDSLREKLKIADRKCASHEAVITDLERKLSIYQSKAATVETYKTNLENAKVELEKKLLHKESQIKYLNNELMNASEKYSKSDREDFIEIIEDIKTKAHDEKSALKKALKFAKAHSKEKEETFKKLLEEASEKEKMIFDLAAQRDQLKVQLTVVNNSVIQLRHQIEELKIQNLKLQSEVNEINTSHKKEVAELKSTIDEKCTELDKSLKKKGKLEETIIELENELRKSKQDFKTFKDESVIPKQLDVHKSKETDMHEEILHLITALQNTRETFEKLIHSSRHMSDSADHLTENAEFGSYQTEILGIVNDIKKYILELKNQLLPLLCDQKEVTNPKSLLKKNDLEKRLQEVEHMYKSAQRENELLKQKLDDLRSSNLATSNAQNTEKYFSVDKPSDNTARNLQLEIYKKDSEIASLKYDLAQRDKYLENQLKESKETLRKLEIENAKIPNLEEELKNTKLELSFIQRKKEEETTTLLQRSQELQESLDKKTGECKNLEQYIQLIKTSYFKVFGNS